MQPKYKIYATLLDSYFNYLNSDVIYERYYGSVSYTHLTLPTIA